MVRQDECGSWSASSAGWMPESMGKRSDGVGRRNLVTMRKLSISDGYKHMVQK